MTARAMWDRELSRNTPVDRETERANVRAGRRDLLVTHNLRFAMQQAHRYKRRGVPLEDLVQAANLGLIRASQDFDPEMGTKFTTYAGHWIRHAIERHIHDHGFNIARLPVHAHRILYAIRRGQVKTPEDIVAMFDVRHETARQLIEHSTLYGKSLNEDERDDVAPLQVSYADAEPPDVAAATAERDALVRVALGMLTDKERAVIERRFFDSQDTFEEIGHDLGVTRERVRQIEAQALGHLRRVFASIELVTPKKRAEWIDDSAPPPPPRATYSLPTITRAELARLKPPHAEEEIEEMPMSLREPTRHPSTPSTTPTTPTSPALDERTKVSRARGTFAALTEEQRTSIGQRVVQGESPARLAKEYGIGVAAARNLSVSHGGAAPLEQRHREHAAWLKTQPSPPTLAEFKERCGMAYVTAHGFLVELGILRPDPVSPARKTRAELEAELEALKRQLASKNP